jgi:hypothetical protein
MPLDNPVLANYLLPLPDPTEGVRKDLELATGLQQSQQTAQINALKIQEAQRQITAEQAAAQRKSDFQREFSTLAQNPDQNATTAFLFKYPEFTEQIKAGSEALSNAEVKQLVPLYAAAVKGARDVVVRETNNLITTYDNSKMPQKAQALRVFLDNYNANPGGTTAVLAGRLAADMGIGKFAETFSKLVEQPADLAKKEADAKTAGVTAQYAERKTKADIAGTEATTASALATAAETRQKTADLQKLSPGLAPAQQAELEKKKLDVEKLKVDIGTLPEAIGKQVGERVDAAEKNQATATTAGNLAGQFDKIEGIRASGAPARADAAFQRLWGNEGTRTALRQEYQQLVNRATLEELRGVRMTENEIHLIQSGFPEATANPKLVADFLRGLQKLSQGKADNETAKAQWLSGNRNLGPATKPLTVLGEKVKPGTDFTEFTAARQAKAAEAAAKQTPAASAPTAPAPGSPAASDPAKAARAAAIRARLAQINQGGVG